MGLTGKWIEMTMKGFNMNDICILIESWDFTELFTINEGV
jgi:hypothetical protein